MKQYKEIDWYEIQLFRNVKSKFIPTVKIKLIDIKGQSAFNTDNRTNNAGYRSLFDFPPATYVLKVKGVFGNIVRYDLHLLKTDSTFNASNGNFEISCEFVGKSFVPLTDIKLGWIKAVSRINSTNPDSTNTNNGSQVDNFQDFIDDDLMTFTNNKIVVNTLGRLVIRNIAMKFDPLINQGVGTYSKTI